MHFYLCGGCVEAAVSAGRAAWATHLGGGTQGGTCYAESRLYTNLLALVLLIALGLCGCQSYSTPYLDEQGCLNDRYKKGEITRDEYEQDLSRQRVQPWGATGEAKPKQDHWSF